MDKIKNHLRKWAIWCAAIFTVFTNLTLPAKAASGNVSLGSKINYSYNVTDSAGNRFWTASTNYIYADGEIAFCIEPALVVDPSAAYSYSNYTATQRRVMERIAYIGWETSNKTADDYFATQLYIWESLGTTINSTSFPNYATKKAIIQQKIDKVFNKAPSFGTDTIELDVGESITLTDSNTVFENYYLGSKDDGIEVSHNGNSLTITATSDAAESSIVRYQLIKNEYVGTSIIYSSSKAQDVVTFKIEDPNDIKLNIKVNKYGSLKLAKQDEDGTYVPGTSFKLSYNSGMSDPIGTYTTGSDGIVTVDNLDPKTIYVQETAVPGHLVLDSTVYPITIKPNDTVTYTATNNWIKGKIQLKKTDSEDNSQVAGATYAIYDNKGQEMQRLVTTATGFVESGYLRFGDYTVKEVIAPTGYVLNDTVYSIRISSNEQKIEVIGTDNPVKGYIQVEKLDADSGKTVAKSGAVFSVYKNDGTFVQDITTDSTGKAITDALRYGDFYLLEKIAPDGYTHSDQKIIYNIREDGKTYSATLSNKQVTASIDLTKIDSITGDAQGEATLEGAVYGLYARKAIKNPADGSTKYAADTLIKELKTDKDGKASVNNLYLGEYYLKEISASDGYTLDTTEYDIILSYADQNTEIVTAAQTVKERVISQAFSLIKISDNNVGEADILKGVEFTVKAQKDIDAAGSWEKAPIAKNSQGEDAAVLVTDEKGYALSDELPYGSYVVRETKVPDDHYQIDDFTVVIDEDSRKPQPWRIFNDVKFRAVVAVVKQDAETGNTIRLSGATFKIRNIDTGDFVGSWVWNPLPHYVDSWTTNESGSVMTDNVLDPGNYELIETKAPDGYTLNSEPIPFRVGMNVAYETLPDGLTPVITVKMKDTSVKGQLSVSKEGEVLISADKNDQGNIDFIYETRKLPGAVFDIFAKEDIMSADNQGDVIYQKDSLIETVTTGSDGTAKSKELPLGSYYVNERTSPDGFTHSDEVKDAVLEYKDQDTALVFTDAGTYENERQKVSVQVIKKDADTNTPLYGAVFGIYAKQDIKSYDGEPLVAKDTLIETAISAEDGTVEFTSDLPLSEYYIKELQAPVGYASSDAVMDVDAGYQGQDVDIIVYQRDFTNEITKVEISKKDITNNEEISGASLSVYPKGEPGAVFASWISGSDGVNEDGTLKPHMLEGLEPGVTYVLHEVSSPYGYAIASDVEFTVLDTGEVQSVEMKDELVMGQLIWNKTGEIFNQTITGQTEFGKTESPVWSESNLLGAEITIYAAEDIKIGNHTIYKTDEKVEVLESDWEDVLSKKLPAGRYFYQETKVPHGYLVNTNKHFFEVEDNQINELQMISSTLADLRATVDIDMTKTLEKQDIFENEEAYKDVIFGIFAREDIYDYMGNVAIPSDTMIATSGINEDGHLVNVPDLPNGVYFVKELATNDQYILDTKEYDFEIAYHGSDVSAYTVQIGTDGTIINELARGSILIQKLDTLDPELKLEGVEFNLSTNKDMSDIISTAETDNDGIASFVDLELGVYYIQESKQLDGYVLNDHIYKVEVTADGDVLQINCENKPTEMIFSKVGETGTEELPGAVLQVIEKETGTVIDEWTSAEESHVISYLIEGKSYKLKEITAPYGYETAEEIDFTAGDGQKVTMKDMMIRSYVSVQKVDYYDHSDVLKDAEFTLYSDEECKAPIRTQRTDKDGVVTFNDLIYGVYFIKETKAPAGYQLSKDIITVEINDDWVNGDKDTRIIIFPDTPLPGGIHTGDHTDIYFWMGAFGFSLGALLIFIKKQKQKRSV